MLCRPGYVAKPKYRATSFQVFRRMVFTSWQFVAFVAAIFLLYYVPPLRRFQVHILVVASLIFYGTGQTELLPLLALAVFGTYLCLLLTLRDRRWLSIGIAFNLGLLAFF